VTKYGALQGTKTELFLNEYLKRPQMNFVLWV